MLVGFVGAWAMLEAVLGAQLRTNYNLMQVVWCRYAVHLTTLVLLFGWRQPQRLWQTRRPLYHLTRSLLMLVMPLSFALAIVGGSPPSAVWAVFWIAPLLILGFARALLRERQSARVWLLATLSALVAFTMLVPLRRPAPVLVMALPMTLSFSLYVVMTRSLHGEPTRVNLLYTALGVFLVLTPLMPMVWIMPSLHDAIALAGVGLGGLVALWALDRSTAFAPVSAIAPLLPLQIVCLLVLGLLFHGERLSARALAGAALLVAIAVIQVSPADRAGAVQRDVLASLSEGSAR